MIFLSPLTPRKGTETAFHEERRILPEHALSPQTPLKGTETKQHSQDQQPDTLPFHSNHPARGRKP